MCAQFVCALYKDDRRVRICVKPVFDKGHVPDEFLTVAVADKGLKAEKMVGSEAKC
jgi:hypothetical protein